MKKPRETAARWLRQAEHDLSIAQKLREESPADACYFSEQAAQKALKAFMYLHGSREVMEHSVVFLAEQCAKQDTAFEAFIRHGQTLDPYYITTRYPDALPDPAVPFETYSVAQADEGIRLAGEIVAAVRAKLGT